GNVIGGTAAGAGNVISGNDNDGVEIGGADTSGNVVLGNFIGTDYTGSAALGNAEDGVYLWGGTTGNVIGGTAAGARNVISGNEWNGVEISSAHTSGNVVLGNFIGTDYTGSAALGNGDGVALNDGSSSNTIGGTAAGAGNVISGNDSYGV